MDGCTSLGKPDRWSHEAWCLTVAMAMEHATVSATFQDACKVVLARRWPSKMMDLNWSLLSSSMMSINSVNLE